MKAKAGAEPSVEVSLREATVEDAATLDAWRADPVAVGEFNDFGATSSVTYAERLASGSLIWPEGGLLLVEADGSPVGTVTWHLVGYGPNPESAAWNIGISLVPSARGQGIGPKAQRLLAERLLADTMVNRIEASTDVANVAEQRALEKAGFVREGVLRGAQYRHGRWHDLVGYSLLRADVTPIAPDKS